MATATLTAKVSTVGVKRADGDLKRFTRSANDAEIKTSKLGNSFKSFGRNASASIAAIDGPLGGVSSRVTALTSVVSSGSLAVTGLALAVTSLSAAVTLGVFELDKQAIALKTSEALLRATGNAAGVTARQLEDEARAIALNTLASVDGIRQAQAILLTFNRIQGDVRSDAVGLAQDLAQVFGGTAASQATQLGKALQDPTKGITALTRVGVTFTEQQKEQIQVLQESGDVLAAQGIILEELKGQVGGVAAAVSSGTLAGGYDEFIQRLKEVSALLAGESGGYDITLSFFEKLNDGLEKINDTFSDEGQFRSAVQSVNSLTKEYEFLKNRIDDLRNVGIVQESVIKQEEIRLKVIKQSIDAEQAIVDQFISDKEKTNLEELKVQEDSAAKQVQFAQEAADAQVKINNEKLAKIAEREEAAAVKALDKLLTLNETKSDTIARVEQERLAATKEALDKGYITQVQALDAEIAANVAASEAMREIKLKEEDERLKKKEDAANDLQEFIALNNTELEEVARVEQERLDIIQSFRDQGLSSEEEYNAARVEIERSASEQRKDIAEAEAKKRADIDEKTRRTRRNTAEGVLSDLETIGGKETKAFKAAAKVNAVVKTYEAANSAFASLASIPIVGPALGAVAATVAVAAGLANVRAIDSAREQGGQISAGQNVLVGERGPEIITAAANSRVRTGNQMKGIMSENSSQPNVSIVVIDQSEGKKEFDQTSDDDGRIILLIRNTVSADAANANSSMRKSLASSTDLQARRV